MMHKIQLNRLRPIVVIIILFVFMFKTQQYNSGWLFIDKLINFLIYASFWMLPHNWWKPARIIMATAAVSILVIISLLLQNSQLSIYMMIILTIPAVYVFEDFFYFYYIGALIFEMFLLLMFFGHGDYLQLIPLIGLFVSLAFSIRARINRIEAYRLSQLHLKELEKAHKELQQAAVTTMQHAVLDERTRIAREIHDAVGHSLTSLIVQMQALRYMLEADPAQAKQSVEEMLRVARQGLNDIRVSVHALAADQSALGISPLQALISKINATTNLSCTFMAGEQAEEIPAETGAVLFKVLQEAMTNILKHAQATKVDVNVYVSGKECVMRINDNGRFIGTNPFNEGFGLKSMRERVQEAYGTIELIPEFPSGLSITTKIPYLPQTGQSKESSF